MVITTGVELVQANHQLVQTNHQLVQMTTTMKSYNNNSTQLTASV